jgi:nicotinamidase-related amidase
MNNRAALFIDYQPQFILDSDKDIFPAITSFYNECKEQNIPSFIIETDPHKGRSVVGDDYAKPLTKILGNAFYQTELEELVKPFDSLYLAGLFTSYCIFFTAYHAKEKLKLNLFSKKNLLADFSLSSINNPAEKKAVTSLQESRTHWVNENITFLDDCL